MKPRKVIVGCEMSGRVRDAFAALGWDAWSCDLIPSETPGKHVCGDVLAILGDGWDLGLFFPPCTHLCVSGAKWFAAKRADGRQQAAIDFVRRLADAPIPHICMENPVGVLSTQWRKPDCIIHPWMFGHMEQKTTCLWLKNLPPLVATDDCREAMLKLPKNQRERLHYLPPSPGRAAERSRTFPGIARAFAEQFTAAICSQQTNKGIQ